MERPIEKIIKHLQKYSFPVTVGEKDEWFEYEDLYVNNKLHVEEMNNEMLFREIEDLRKKLTKEEAEVCRLLDLIPDIDKERQRNYSSFGTMDNLCEHEIEKLYNKNGNYKADYCKKCKGLY